MAYKEKYSFTTASTGGSTSMEFRCFYALLNDREIELMRKQNPYELELLEAAAKRFEKAKKTEYIGVALLIILIGFIVLIIVQESAKIANEWQSQALINLKVSGNIGRYPILDYFV